MLKKPDTEKRVDDWAKGIEDRIRVFSNQGYGYTRKQRDQVAGVEPQPRLKIHPKKRQGKGLGGVW